MSFSYHMTLSTKEERLGNALAPLQEDKYLGILGRYKSWLSSSNLASSVLSALTCKTLVCQTKVDELLLSLGQSDKKMRSNVQA